MPLFSENDINEAKRRVWEMQNKAKGFTDGKSERDEAPVNAPVNQETEAVKENESKGAEVQDDRSSLVILALILLLSKEEADSSLILALLYLLF